MARWPANRNDSIGQNRRLKEADSSANRITMHKYNGTSLYEHPLKTDTSLLRHSLLCPWGKKPLTFSLNRTRLILGFNTDTPSVFVSRRLTTTFFVTMNNRLGTLELHSGTRDFTLENQKTVVELC